MKNKIIKLVIGNNMKMAKLNTYDICNHLNLFASIKMFQSLFWI